MIVEVLAGVGLIVDGVGLSDFSLPRELRDAEEVPTWKFLFIEIKMGTGSVSRCGHDHYRLHAQDAPLTSVFNVNQPGQSW